VKLFGKWSFAGIEIRDISVEASSPLIVPGSFIHIAAYLLENVML